VRHTSHKYSNDIVDGQGEALDQVKADTSAREPQKEISPPQ